MSISNIVLPFVANPAQIPHFHLTGRDSEPKRLRRGLGKRQLTTLRPAVPLREGAGKCLGSTSLCTLHW